MADLKPGWKRVKFGQIVECVNDRVDDPSKAGVERYVGLDHLDPDSLTIRRWGAPDEVGSTKLRFRPGDIIFGKRRAYQRKLAVADFEGICSAHAMVLRARPSMVLPGFLPFLMQSDMFMERAVRISVGSLSPTISWKTLAAEEFALPPMGGQMVMRDVFDGAVEHLEALRQAYEHAGTAFRVHVINAFRGTNHGAEAGRIRRAGHSKTWQIVSVADAGEIQLGQKREPSVHEGSNLRPYLRVANVFDGYFDFSDLLQMHFPPKDIEKYELRKGDILLHEGQSADLVGRSCLWNDERPGTCFQMTLIRFRPGPRVLPEFAQLYFRYCLYAGIFRGTAVQTTSIAHLTATRFSKMSFPIPPMDEQQRLVDRAQIYENAMKTLGARVEETKSLCRGLIDGQLSG